MSGFLKKNPIFCELSYKFALEDFHKTGLDVLFYGQEHYDTLAILSMKDDMSNEKVADLMTNQRLFSNKDMMIKNLDHLIQNLKECEDYIQQVLVTRVSFHLLLGQKSRAKFRHSSGIEPMH